MLKRLTPDLSEVKLRWVWLVVGRVTARQGKPYGRPIESPAWVRECFNYVRGWLLLLLGTTAGVVEASLCLETGHYH